MIHIGRCSRLCAIALAAGTLGTGSAMAASARGYETDPRDVVNPADYVAGGTATTTPPTSSSGYYINPMTGERVADPGRTGGAARPTATEINTYVGNEYRPAGTNSTVGTAAERERSGTWYKPWTYIGGKKTETNGYEPERAPADPRPAVVPTFVPGPTQPGPTIVYRPGHTNVSCGPDGCGPDGTACSSFSVTGISSDIPAGIGIQLPSGSNLNVTTAQVPYTSPNLRDVGTPGVNYTPSSPPAPMPTPGGYATPVSYAPPTASYSTTAPSSYPTNMPPPGGYTTQPPAPAPAYVPPPMPTTNLASAEGQAAFERGKALMRQEQFEAALAQIDLAIANGYATADAYRWKGDGLYNLLRLQEAVQAYDQSLQLQDSYFARRGRGLAHLHRGHQIHGFQKEAEARGDRQAVAENFARAHDEYLAALNELRRCVTERSNDPDAIYGLAMAAEGTSRFYYSMAIVYLRKGERSLADKAANECLQTIKEGLDYAHIRYEKYGKAKKEAGPLSLAGGLFLRKAKLEHMWNQNDQALRDVQFAIRAHQMILDEIDPNNAAAQEGIQICRREYDIISGAAST